MSVRRLVAIDPGSTRSALVGLEAPHPRSTTQFLPVVCERLLLPNAEILEALGKCAASYDLLAIEQMRARGMPTANEELDTVEWSGRFIQRWCDSPSAREYQRGVRVDRAAKREATIRRIPRAQVKLELCGSVRARDANIRAALLDLYGGKAAAMGRKAAPGPLYAIAADLWSALAIGLTALRVT